MSKMDKVTQMSAKQLMQHAMYGTVPDGAILIVNEDATLTEVEQFAPLTINITNPYANLPQLTTTIKGQFKKKRKQNNRKKKRRK